MSHELRWNPLLREWIIVSGKRDERPWRREHCPFCAGELETQGSWDVLALRNKFPALSPDAPALSGKNPYYRPSALGYCEVILETSEHEGDFHTIPLGQVSRYLRLLADRTLALGSEHSVKYVVPFKNKGMRIGVSMTHPHSQLYALPFIPPRIRREIASAKEFATRYGQNLFEAIFRQEIEEKSRLIYGNERFTLVLPFFAMWPLEMHIYGSIPAKTPNELNEQLRLMLADAIRAATAIYEECLGEDYAYMMIFHQAPSKGEYLEYRLHVEFYSPQLSKEKVKYAAGIEWGAGTFTYDGVPEERAAQLREAGATALTNIEHLGTLSRDT